MIALLVFAVALAMQFHHAPEPAYQGRALTQWLKQSMADNSATNYENCNNAVRAIGTNGIPTLLKLLETKESAIGGKIQEAFDGMKWKSLDWLGPSYKPRLAIIGFWALGDVGKPAQAKLAELAGPGHSAETQASALWCLEGINADKQFLVPLLVQNLTNQNRKLAGYARQRLYVLAPEMMTNWFTTQTNVVKQ